MSSNKTAVAPHSDQYNQLQRADAGEERVSAGKHLAQQLVEVTREVACLPIAFVNVYFVGAANAQDWFLVDTGLRGFGSRIKSEAAKRYGKTARPRFIVLTHGHFDHAGNALALAEEWNVPVLAHRLEMPFLTGKDYYPPPDPTVGGFLAFLSRAFPASGIDLGSRVQEVNDTLPNFGDWQVIETPGHTTGHISLFNEKDKTVIAGDALASVNQESVLATLTNTQSVQGPPIPLTTDWEAARKSVEKLAELNPRALACGHGAPLTRASLADELKTFACGFDRRAVPAHGRYVNESVATNEQGIVRLPPPVADPLGTTLKSVGLAALAGGLIYAATKRKRTRLRRPRVKRNQNF